MIDPAQIFDPASLQKWLAAYSVEQGEWEGRRFACWIAHRAAMRVLPVYFDWLVSVRPKSKREMVPLRAIRPLLISGLAGTWPRRFAHSIVDDQEAKVNTAYPDHLKDQAKYHEAAAADMATISADVSAAVTASAKFVFRTSEAVQTAAAIYSVKDVLWENVRNDATVDPQDYLRKLWIDKNPFHSTWQNSCDYLREPAWAFWVCWYDAALDGTLYRDENRTLLTRIALIGRNPETGELIGDEEWDKGPEHIARLIAEIEGDLKRGDDERTPLAAASIYEYRREGRDVLREWMVLIGYDEDLKFIEDRDRLRSFNRDAEALIEGLRTFVDFARDRLSGVNETPDVLRAAEDALKELERSRIAIDIRARVLIEKSAYLNQFALESDPAAIFGDVIATMLSDRIADLIELSRNHLSATLLKLEPLAQLDLGDRAPGELVRKLHTAIDPLITEVGAEGLTRLSDEGRVNFSRMLRDLERLATAIEGAPPGSLRAQSLRRDFAESYGKIVVAIGRYVERSNKNSSDWADRIIAMVQRLEDFDDLVVLVEALVEIVSRVV